MESKGFFKFEIIINVLVTCFRFIWIPVLWVYINQKYFIFHSAEIDFRRQDLTSTDVRSWRLKSIPVRVNPWSTDVDYANYISVSVILFQLVQPVF